MRSIQDGRRFPERGTSKMFGKAMYDARHADDSFVSEVREAVTAMGAGRDYLLLSRAGDSPRGMTATFADGGLAARLAAGELAEVTGREYAAHEAAERGDVESTREEAARSKDVARDGLRRKAGTTHWMPKTRELRVAVGQALKLGPEFKRDGWFDKAARVRRPHVLEKAVGDDVMALRRFIGEIEVAVQDSAVRAQAAVDRAGDVVLLGDAGPVRRGDGTRMAVWAAIAWRARAVADALGEAATADRESAVALTSADTAGFNLQRGDVAGAAHEATASVAGVECAIAALRRAIKAARAERFWAQAQDDAWVIGRRRIALDPLVGRLAMAQAGGPAVGRCEDAGAVALMDVKAVAEARTRIVAADAPARHLQASRAAAVLPWADARYRGHANAGALRDAIGRMIAVAAVRTVRAYNAAVDAAAAAGAAETQARRIEALRA